MEFEKRPGLPPKTPEQWHEAIRANMSGNLITPSQFTSFESVTKDGIPYIVQSFTKGCEVDGFVEGVFITMIVPESSKNEVRELVLPIVYDLREIVKKDLESKADNPEDLYQMEEDPGFSGVVTKIARKSAMGLSFAFTQSGNCIVSLSPMTDEDLKKTARAKILDEYFRKMSLFERVRLMEAPIVNDNLRAAIMKEETAINSKAIEILQKKGGLTSNELNALETDAEIQEIFQDFHKLILEAPTAKQMKDLDIAYSMFEPILKAGFLQFYQKYWEGRLSRSF